jgi:hypothetical protein
MSEKRRRRLKPDEPDLSVILGFVLRMTEGPTGQCQMYLDSKGNEALVALIRANEAAFMPALNLLERTVASILSAERTEPDPWIASGKVGIA